MKRKAGFSSRARAIRKRELKKESDTTKLELFLLFVTLLSASTILIMFTSHYLMTGYATSIESYAGDITEIILYRKFPTVHWNGVYGLALRVPCFTEQLYRNFNNEIGRQDLFFDCIDPSDANGNEVFASTSNTIDFDTLNPGDLTELANFMGCGDAVYCAANTFTDTMWIMLGARNVSGIPSSHTFKWDGDNEQFDIGYLEDGSGNKVFVSHIANMQKGYSQNVTVNFQMLLPTPEGVTQTFYFFTDPNDVCPEGGGLGEVVEAHVHGYIKD